MYGLANWDKGHGRIRFYSGRKVTTCTPISSLKRHFDVMNVEIPSSSASLSKRLQQQTQSNFDYDYLDDAELSFLLKTKVSQIESCFAIARGPKEDYSMTKIYMLRLART